LLRRWFTLGSLGVKEVQDELLLRAGEVDFPAAKLRRWISNVTDPLVSVLRCGPCFSKDYESAMAENRGREGNATGEAGAHDNALLAGKVSALG